MFSGILVIDMISAKFRFHGHGSLKFLHKNARTNRSRYFTVKYVSNPHRKYSRFSVVVSKKVHKSAVGRNRIRRRVYEILRIANSEGHIKGVVDVAVIVTSGEALGAEYLILRDSLVESLQELGIYQ